MADSVTAERLKTRRKFLDVSQAQLGRDLSVPRGSVNNWETGGSVPRPDLLVRVATRLRTTTDYLLGRVDDPDQPEMADLLREPTIDNALRLLNQARLMLEQLKADQAAPTTAAAAVGRRTRRRPGQT